jgi:hypothetical protein
LRWWHSIVEVSEWFESFNMLWHILCPFDWKEENWKERKLQKSMNEFRLKINSNSFIDFCNFLSSHFLSLRRNRYQTYVCVIFSTYQLYPHWFFCFLCWQLRIRFKTRVRRVYAARDSRFCVWVPPFWECVINEP